MDNSKELPTVISFCTGYGGIERGLDLAGIKHKVIAYVEIEAYVIANLVDKMESGKLAPAPIWTDLKTFPAHLFRDRTSIITGGYPCQPFSAAGKRQGADDPRHLWPYIRQHIQTIRPERTFFENVEGHISLGLSTVISDLEEDGYAAAWGIFSAREVGASHQRKRVFILGNSKHYGSSTPKKRRSVEATSSDNKEGQVEASESERAGKPQSGRDLSGGQGLAYSQGERVQGLRASGKQKSGAYGQQELLVRKGKRSEYAKWLLEPRVGRVVDGCADRVDRIRLLGNAVVPQTAAKAWEALGERNAKN